MQSCGHLALGILVQTMLRPATVGVSLFIKRSKPYAIRKKPYALFADVYLHTFCKYIVNIDESLLKLHSPNIRKRAHVPLLLTNTYGDVFLPSCQEGILWKHCERWTRTQL